PMRPGGTVSSAGYYVRDAAEIEHSSSSAGAEPITLVDARGSCGGGSVAWDMEQRTPLVKESAWFQRYNVRPAEVFALFADGDSMADFIVDGDIVIFNSSKTVPRS